MIDASLDDGMTAAGISRQLEAIGATVDPDVINRHRKHYADDRPIAPKGTPKRDIAVMIRDKVADKIESADGDEMEAILFTKSGQGAIAAGLKAQKLIEDREKEKAKTGRSVELLSALFAIVGIGPTPVVAALDDGMTVEGEAVEVDGSPQ
jgi:hypothetical protein